MHGIHGIHGMPDRTRPCRAVPCRCDGLARIQETAGRARVSTNVKKLSGLSAPFLVKKSCRCSGVYSKLIESSFCALPLDTRLVYKMGRLGDEVDCKANCLQGKWFTRQKVHRCCEVYGTRFASLANYLANMLQDLQTVSHSLQVSRVCVLSCSWKAVALLWIVIQLPTHPVRT